MISGAAEGRPARERGGRSTATAARTVLVLAAGAGAAFSGCHPTGTPILDPAYAAVFAAVVCLLGGVSGRGGLLWLAVVATALARGWLLIPAAAALGLAFAGTFPRRANAVLNCVVAATAVQVVLRWDVHGFQGATALAAAAAVTPLLFSGLRHTTRRTRRAVAWGCAAAGALTVVVVVPVVVAALMSRSQVEAGISEAQQALRQVASGRTESARGNLVAATSDLRSGAGRLDAWWTVGARFVPLAAQQRQALAIGVSVARDVAQAADDEDSKVNLSQIRYSDGGIDLARIQDLAGPLAAINVELDHAAGRLGSARSHWDVSAVASRLGRLDQTVTSARASTRLAAEAVRTVPSLLGGEGVRHYFVGFMDSSESRGLGGTLTWYGILTADAGHLSMTTEGDPGVLAQSLVAKGGGHLSGPADFVARYGQFDPQAGFIDLTYAPDLPTVTSVVSQLYAQATGQQLDGAIMLDPKSVASFLALTGPVRVAGLGELTGANAAAMLEKDQYALFPGLGQRAERRQALDTALKAAAEHLTGGVLPDAGTVVSDLAPDVSSGNLLFWSTHTRDQALLSDTGLAGSFPTADRGDLLGVITQNAANNKVDAYLQRLIADDVRYDPADGRVTSTVTVTLYNGVPSGLSDEVIGSYEGSGLAPGSDLLWFSVYSPLALQGAEVGSEPVQLTSTPELGVNTYSGYVTVPAGSAATVTVHLAGRVAPGSYRITVHSQPTVLPDKDTVQVTPQTGWRDDGPAAWGPIGQSDTSHLFQFARMR